MSEKKAQAIYSAVHEEIMRLRIALRMAVKPYAQLDADKLDFQIAQAGDRAGAAAVDAYRKPLRPHKTLREPGTPTETP